MSIDLNAFNKFFIDYQQRFVHFACTYVHDEAVAEAHGVRFVSLTHRGQKIEIE